MSRTSTLKAFRRKLQQAGFSVTKTRGGHWRFEHPNMLGPVFGPDTPSDNRSVKNLLAEIRRRMRP